MSQLKADHGLRAPFLPAGVTIPDLPEDASDEEILAALAKLDAAKTKLLAGRKALAEEAEKVCAFQNNGMTDEEAREKSSLIMRLLAETKQSITESTGIGGL